MIYKAFDPITPEILTSLSVYVIVPIESMDVASDGNWRPTHCNSPSVLFFLVYIQYFGIVHKLAGVVVLSKCVPYKINIIYPTVVFFYSLGLTSIVTLQHI